MRKPADDKTWILFIDHFPTAYQELRDTDATIDELGYHSANAILEQIVDWLQNKQEDDSETSYEVSTSVHPIVHPMTPIPPVMTIPIQQANAVIDPNIVIMEQTIIIMSTMFETMQHNGNHHGRGYGRGRGCGRAFQYGRRRGRGHVAVVDSHLDNTLIVDAIVPPMEIVLIPAHNM